MTERLFQSEPPEISERDVSNPGQSGKLTRITRLATDQVANKSLLVVVMNPRQPQVPQGRTIGESGRPGCSLPVPEVDVAEPGKTLFLQKLQVGVKDFLGWGSMAQQFTHEHMGARPAQKTLETRHLTWRADKHNLHATFCAGFNLMISIPHAALKILGASERRHIFTAGDFAMPQFEAGIKGGGKDLAALTHDRLRQDRKNSA
jgi:hypothetical protein